MLVSLSILLSMTSAIQLNNMVSEKDTSAAQKEPIGKVVDQMSFVVKLMD